MKKFFLSVGIAFMVLFASQIFVAYVANHTYYATMFADTTNIQLLMIAIVAAMIPLGYMRLVSKKSMTGALIALFVGLLVFALGYVSARDTLVGTGFLMLLVNVTLVFGLGLAFVTSCFVLGNRTKQLLTFLPDDITHDTTIGGVVVDFIVGFITFVLLNFILILCNLYYAPVVRLMVIGLVWLIRKSRPLLDHTGQIIISQLTTISHKELSPATIVAMILFVVSVIYYYYGFMLAYIPYPTARDANHAYMFVPKIRSANYGFLRNAAGGIIAPRFYSAYLTFWFTLTNSLGSGFWIAPDTIAVEMNFLTGIWALCAVLVTLKQLILYGSPDIIESDSSSVAHHIGWFAMLLWMTSGMGAFLLFVDNKTDMAIMTMTTLALYFGFKHLNSMVQNLAPHRRYLIFSGVLFGIAVVSKPTALFDSLNFALLLLFTTIGLVGIIGVGVMTWGVVVAAKMGGTEQYFGQSAIKSLFATGSGGVILGAGLQVRKKLTSLWPSLQSFLIRGGVLVFTLLLLKGPVMIYRNIIAPGGRNSIQAVKDILLGQTPSSPQRVLLTSNIDHRLLLAQSPATIDAMSGSMTTVTSDIALVPSTALSKSQCSLSQLQLTTGELFTGLKAMIGNGFNEDVGRYVGYGQKEFTGKFLSLLPSGCYGRDRLALTLCNQSSKIDTLELSRLASLLSGYQAGSDESLFLSGAFALFQSDLPTAKIDTIKLLTDYRKGSVVLSKDGVIGIPYKMLVPLNVTFNRSLQNLSSYYTDIGTIRLVLQFFLLCAVVYGIISRDTALTAVSGVALVGRAIWIVVGGGIVRYGIGLITRTILGSALYFHKILKSDGDVTTTRLSQILIVLLAMMGVIQLVMNFIRISSQGGSGPFVQYKFNNGYVYEYDENLSPKSTLKISTLKRKYTAQDVFNLQFPHYNKILSVLNTGNGFHDYATLVAGTYIKYFIKDQKNIYDDGFLGDTRQQFSDGDVCKSYLRLQSKQKKYLIIDPNIATVVMGGGNSTLMDRFFAKLDPVSGKIIQDGAMTMFSKLVDGGYMNLYHSNNIGSKYAFILPRQILSSTFGVTEDADIALVRAKLATARFRPDSNKLFGLITNVLDQRVKNADAIGDIADIIGKVVDTTKLKTIATEYIQSKNNATLLSRVKALSQDERAVLANYLGLYQMSQTSTEQYQKTLQDLIGQSIGGSSQLIVFEVL